MAKSDALMIGSFGSYRAGGREVPADMVGKKIWYSKSHDLFAITDDDGHNISSFGFEKFKEYVALGAFLESTAEAVFETEAMRTKGILASL